MRSSKTGVNNNDQKNNNEQKNDNDSVSWDFSDDEEHTAMEATQDDDDDDDEGDDDLEDGDDEGIDDEAAKKYKPYKHRDLISPVTNMEARIHLLNGCLGLGVVVLPSAMSRFGVVYATFGLILVGVISAHCLHILIKSTYRVYCRLKVPQLTYSKCIGYAVQAACGLSPKHVPVITGFVTCLVFFCQLSIASIYVKYIIRNILQTLKPVCEECYKHEAIVQAIMVIPLILINSVPTIRDLVYCSFIGNLCSFAALGLIMHDAVSHLRNGHVDGFIRISQYPQFVGVALFATHTLGVVLLLERNMRKPKVLIGPRGIVNQIMILVIVTYIVFGFVGAVSIRSNRVKRKIIDRIPFASKLTYNATTILILVCFFSHPLVCYEMFDILWRTRLRSYVQDTLPVNPRVIKYSMRAFIVILTVSVAYVKIHDIATVISLCGTLLISVVGVILPSLLHLLTSAFTRYKMIKHILVISFGISAFIGGIFELIKVLNK